MARAHRAPAARGLPLSANAASQSHHKNTHTQLEHNPLKTLSETSQNHLRNLAIPSHKPRLSIPSPTHMPSSGISGSLRSPKMPSSWHMLGVRSVPSSLYRFGLIHHHSASYMPSSGISGSLRSPKMPSSWHIFGYLSSALMHNRLADTTGASRTTSTKSEVCGQICS